VGLHKDARHILPMISGYRLRRPLSTLYRTSINHPGHGSFDIASKVAQRFTARISDAKKKAPWRGHSVIPKAL